MMFPRERVLLADGGRPQTRYDLELLLEHRESIRGRGERDRVRGVLGVVPTRAEPELDAPAAHRVGLRDLDRERARKSEGDGRDECAEPDACRLAAERGERPPGGRGTRSRR